MNEYGQQTKTGVLQNLTVLVAEVETGALVHTEDPNYALLARATQTIQSLISRIFTGELTKPAPTRLIEAVSLPVADDDVDEETAYWINQNPWDFEMDFWNNLAEHPILA